MNLRPRKIRNQLFQWVSTKPHVEALWSLSIRSSSLKVPGPGLGTSDLETVGQVQAQVSSSRDVAGSHMETGTQKRSGRVAGGVSQHCGLEGVSNLKMRQAGLTIDEQGDSSPSKTSVKAEGCAHPICVC